MRNENLGSCLIVIVFYLGKCQSSVSLHYSECIASCQLSASLQHDDCQLSCLRHISPLHLSISAVSAVLTGCLQCCTVSGCITWSRHQHQHQAHWSLTLAVRPRPVASGLPALQCCSTHRPLLQRHNIICIKSVLVLQTRVDYYISTPDACAVPIPQCYCV